MTNQQIEKQALREAAKLRDKGFSGVITFSPKVFIPLTKLCRDVCHYCTFSRPPRGAEKAYLTPEEALRIAREGEKKGCTEALFTLGDKPELRYSKARNELADLGHDTTVSYLAEVASLVLTKTKLLPHLNPGVLTKQDFEILKPVSVSMGLMLEGISPRLMKRGGVHFGSPDKDPKKRIETIRLAGEAQIPFTTGILIGIGETREETLASLDAIYGLHRRYGHIQEIIIQNFRSKPDTRMANAEEPTLKELLWAIAQARLKFGPEMSIQAPPNLSGEDFHMLLDAGINDWGGVSPVTPDHVNPEAPWPNRSVLEEASASRGKTLVARLPIYPKYIREAGWIDFKVRPSVLRAMDLDGFARDDAWSPGLSNGAPVTPLVSGGAVKELNFSLARILSGNRLEPQEIARFFSTRGEALTEVLKAANCLRQQSVGETVTFAVNRNINYTNVCGYRCGFCAFSKGRLSASLRGRPYDLALEEIERRTAEAWDRGATEVCLQGGIHPDYSGETYLNIVRAVKSAAPDIHIHAFSPLEIKQGAATIGLSVKDYLYQLKEEGLGSLPGTAAEILDDEVRANLCPDKLSTDEWISVNEAAHGCGLRTTATIMFGHIESPLHLATHLLKLRDLQEKTRGFTEFVPLPFVHMEAPLYLKGKARRGPTFREVLLMHAVSRLVLHPLIQNIQTSWVKLGKLGTAACLGAGANDLGGTLMNESISRAAGSSHGQEFSPTAIRRFVEGLGRPVKQRTTLYETVAPKRQHAAINAGKLFPMISTRATKYAHGKAAE